MGLDEKILLYVNQAGTTPVLSAVMDTAKPSSISSNDMAGFAAVARLVKAGKIYRLSVNDRRSEDAIFSLAEARACGFLQSPSGPN